MTGARRGAVVLACAACCVGYRLDGASAAEVFDGIGALSAGASSRALADYPEPARSDILDYLFLPNFGASLQVLKVEIGGDSGSTDGTEASHMRTPTESDYTRGYEWWLMNEAKARNPGIRIAALPWAFPSWVGADPATGAPSGSPYSYPNQTAAYVTKWVEGAVHAHNISVDSVGVWNERASSKEYVLNLRSALDAAGFAKTKIVAKDGGADICADLANDAEYAAAVDVVGLHYPSDYADYSTCRALGKPLWSSEESSSYDDNNGAACWARVMNSHYVLSGMTSNIIWALLGSMYHGTAWYGCGMLTAVEPWSGHYENMQVAWATAHTTQFTQVGWRYLANGTGSGTLERGGYYVTYVSPDGGDFSLVIAKVSHAHAQCIRPKLPEEAVAPEVASFTLAGGLHATRLAVFRSNYEDPASKLLFEQEADVEVANGTFTLSISLGDHITVSTLRSARKGRHTPPPSSPQFPLPYTADFDAVAIGQSGFGFTDQIGSFQVVADATNATNRVTRQGVEALPIGWADPGSQGPVSLIGMKEFQDLAVAVSVRLPTAAPAAAGCVATRANQMWTNAVVFCVNATGGWNLTYGGPPQSGAGGGQTAIATGRAAPLGAGVWGRLQLRTVNGTAEAWVNGVEVASMQIRHIDSGFAAIGVNSWYAVEFDDFALTAEGDRWAAPARCAPPAAGAAVRARPCPTNGVTNDDVRWEMTSSWQIRHAASGLCVTAVTGAPAAELRPCELNAPSQQFTNDYTQLRGMDTYLVVNGTSPAATLRASPSGAVYATAAQPVAAGDWASWVFFPNTKQLRNQYDTEVAKGYPMCLAAC